MSNDAGEQVELVADTGLDRYVIHLAVRLELDEQRLGEPAFPLTLVISFLITLESKQYSYRACSPNFVILRISRR